MFTKTVQTRQTVISFLFLLVCMGFVSPPAWGQNVATVTNVRFDATAEYVVIYYDLVPADTDDSLGVRRMRTGPRPTQYTVSLFLRKESDAEFRYAPKYIGGEVGSGIREGRNRVIQWNIAREFSTGLDGTDYYFEVVAEQFEQSSNIVTWVIGGGAVLLGSTALYFLLSSPDSPPPPPSGSFPPPPGRPGN